MSSEFTPNADELLSNNARFVDGFADSELQVSPLRKLAIVACMDSRMDVFQMLGLGRGEAHVIRNAGGVITDDVIRSLCLSQRKFETREVILLHHTDCGLQKVASDEFTAELEAEVGTMPAWALDGFVDPYADVADSMRRLKQSPFIAYKDHIRGFVYDVTTGELLEVQAGDPVSSA